MGVMTLVGEYVPSKAQWVADQVEKFEATEGQEANILAGLTYVNIHSQMFPGGEIRGQIIPIPEPASAGAALLGIAAFVRRRR